MSHWSPHGYKSPTLLATATITLVLSRQTERNHGILAFMCGCHCLIHLGHEAQTVNITANNSCRGTDMTQQYDFLWCTKRPIGKFFQKDWQNTRLVLIIPKFPNTSEILENKPEKIEKKPMFLQNFWKKNSNRAFPTVMQVLRDWQWPLNRSYVKGDSNDSLYKYIRNIHRFTRKEIIFRF